MSVTSRSIQNVATLRNQLRQDRTLQNTLQQQQREREAAQAEAERQQLAGQAGANYLTGGGPESLATVASVDPDMASTYQEMRGNLTEQDRQEMTDVARTLLPTLRASPEQQEQSYQQARNYLMERYPEEVQEMGLPEEFDEMAVKTRLAGIDDVLSQFQGQPELREGVTPSGDPSYLAVDPVGGTARPIEGGRPAAGGDSDAPAQVQTVRWVMDNITGGDAERAWELSQMSKTNPQQTVVELYQGLRQSADERFADVSDQELWDQALQAYQRLQQEPGLNPMAGQGQEGSPQTAPPQEGQGGQQTAPPRPGAPEGGQPREAPYPEGTRLRGPDGNTYVVQDGRPVPEE